MEDDGGERRGGGFRVDHDNPPFSRIFVVCSRSHTDEEIRAAFGVHGTLEDVWVVKDRITKLNKGIAYVKFSKASEAHIAMEQLHGATIGSDSKPIKALLADNKVQQSRNNPVTAAMNETKHRSRIFILVSRTIEEGELKEEFQKFGNVENVQILKDRATGESKGCAYIKFEKPSEAFSALENCEHTYKAVIAEPRVPKSLVKPQQEHEIVTYHQPTQIHCPIPAGYPDSTEPNAVQRLSITCSHSVSEGQLTRLFDLVPGLEELQLKPRRSGEHKSTAIVHYSRVEQAVYAKRKFNGLEYPPGSRLSVKYDPKEIYFDHSQQQGGQMMDSYSGYSGYGQSQQPSGYNAYPGFGQGQAFPAPPTFPTAYPTNTQPFNPDACPFTTVALPGHQHIAGPSTSCRAKLFFVSAPSPLAAEILEDVFCRFAALIDITPIPGTAYGYIRYGLKESADAAKMLLDNTEIAQNTIRLSHASDTGGDNKRPRNDI